MADISAFPTMPYTHDSEMMSSNGPILTFTASGTIKVGQVVCFAANGASMTVLASIKGAGTVPVGVALDNVTDGEKVAVAMMGCVAEVANADDTATIDTGDWLECNDNAVGGTVNTATFTAASDADARNGQIIGMALEDIGASGTGYMLICPVPQGTTS